MKTWKRMFLKSHTYYIMYPFRLKRIIQLIGGLDFLNFSISELFLLDRNNLFSIANAFDEHVSLNFKLGIL